MLNFQQEDPKDEDLAQAIAREIFSMAAGAHVSVKGGHVTVSGMVDDYATKRDVTAVIHGFSGVKTLCNNMRVTPIGD
ncbi:MAG TPA: BON domain-containing protein [bacterium]|nr:BON domain-containing protein [bacterium]